MATAEIKTCGCCREERKRHRRRPRPLEELPTRTTKRRLPVYACEHCDGSTLDNAVRETKPTDLNLDVSTRPEDG